MDPDNSDCLVLRAARVIDAVADHAEEGLELLIRGGRVEELRPVGEPPPDAEVITLPDATLLPGLIDAHVHYTIDGNLPDGIAAGARHSPAQAALIGARNALSALVSGVTTARSAGASRGLDIALAAAIAAGDVPGPRLLPAGPAITITGGHGQQFGIEVDDPTEMVRAVRRLVRDGAEVIKAVASEAAMLTGPRAGIAELTQEEIHHVVEEAGRLARRVLVHAQDSASVTAAARAGATSVEHAFLADGDALLALRDSGAYLTPTLSVTDVYAHRDDLSAEVEERQRELSRLHRRSSERAVELGIPLIAGTDCGVPAVMPDMLPREVRLLHNHGLSPIEAIRSATSTAAQALGLAGEVGRLEPGFVADVLVVRGDPLADLRALEAPLLVVQGGAVTVRDGCLVGPATRPLPTNRP